MFANIIKVRQSMTDKYFVHGNLIKGFISLERIIHDSRQQLASQIKGGLQPIICSACRGSPPVTNGALTTLALVGDIPFH